MNIYEPRSILFILYFVSIPTLTQELFVTLYFNKYIIIYYLNMADGIFCSSFLRSIGRSRLGGRFQTKNKIKHECIAKILKEAGDEEIECGVPIMVTVEEEDECAAFKDFVVEEEETMVATPAAVVEPVASPPSPVVEAVAPPPPPPAPVVAAAAVAVTEAPVATAETIAAALDPIMTTGWGEYAKLNSPILKTLSKNQSTYVELYGTTGMVPL